MNLTKDADRFGIPICENHSDEILWAGEWIEVRKRDSWYEYVRSRHGVSVLIFDPNSESILVRKEHCPPHGEGFIRTSLTGGVEPGETPSQTAVKEIKEEAGITCAENELYDLGWVFPVKFSDFKQYLFALNGAGKKMEKPEGDGSRGEKGASVEWVSFRDAIEVTDPSVAACMSRMMAFHGIQFIAGE